MDYKDYYKELGVDKSASEADIKKAYRKLVRKYHPDVSKETDADQRTKALNEAYGVLGDAEKRAAYDDLGRQQSAQGGPGAGGGFRPPPDWGAGFESSGVDDNDFFADLFAHVGGRRRANSNFQMQGEDSHAAISIALRDSYHGATRTIVMRVPEADAQGRVVTRERTLEVTIPKGVTEGQQLRMKGQGNPGSGGAPAGDLYLEIRFEQDPRYRVEGRDVFETVPVTPWEAALGGAIDVPTPSGTVSVTVPPESQTGRKLRLKGRGIPASEPGDLYLLLEVVLPPARDDKARALYQTMAREMAFNPRQKLGA
ncbi:DnaJ C-terminal domain-containing protein [Janthinobacterium psychrotolerans]|uniref:Curved DNA-binding protein n=1 Tax=Janthinobacterium psychrotolerans TaxID=1747903 RepID=A0A1A7C0M0_9BURK|nr:DnaJ C-terminal domain-containing protein [Janthinobacterium psychrotolerans]OBV39287.1 curved DNA-binding protein [Janthinobacterium psychrotolerans]